MHACCISTVCINLCAHTHIHRITRKKINCYEIILELAPVACVPHVGNHGNKTFVSVITFLPSFSFVILSPFRLESAIPLLKLELEHVFGQGNYTVAFPDDGACKRFKSYFPQDDCIIFNKTRVGNKRNVQIKDGE